MKRIGIVGAGLIGNWHAERWQQLPVELAGFYDIRAESATQAQERFGGRVYDSLEALVADVDAVDVCTQTNAHKEGVMAAAVGGTPVICEKPLARHLADAQAMVDACEAANVPLFVAQVVRFFPQFALAKASVDAGQIGRAGVIRTIRAGSLPSVGSRPWFSDMVQSGGVIMDLGVHDIDFARWCMGEVERVFVRGTETHALISLRFRSGAIGHIENSWSHPPGQFRTRFEIAGDRGLLEWDSQLDAPLRLAIRESDGGAANGDAPTRRTLSPLAPEDDPYYRELSHFLDCLEDDRPFLVSPQDGLMAVKIALAALESQRRGEPVDIASFEEVPA